MKIKNLKKMLIIKKMIKLKNLFWQKKTKKLKILF